MTSIPEGQNSTEELARVARLVTEAIERAPRVLSPALATAAVEALKAHEGSMAIVADPYVDGRRVSVSRGAVAHAREGRDLAAEILALPPVDGTEVQWGYLTSRGDFVVKSDERLARAYAEASYRRLARRVVGPVQEVTE